MKNWMIAVVVATFAAVAPAAVQAHEGHTHKVMGTLQSIAGNHLTLKTTEGKSVMVMLDAKTRITQGKTRLEASALKVGDRIVAEGMEEKEMIMAATVQVGVSPQASATR